jgi:2-iminobutanoate/2-iminopropanoate deaminase
MEPVSTVKAPAAVGPYSQAVKTGHMLFCSGQIGLVPETGKLAGDDIGSQARQALNNLAAVLEAAGFAPVDVVKTSVFLTDLNHFAVLNRIYADFFEPHKPARATVQVAALPLGALMEIDCIAVKA